jgi:hypothetical protein
MAFEEGFRTSRNDKLRRLSFPQAKRVGNLSWGNVTLSAEGLKRADYTKRKTDEVVL